jgi:hypothetical protein
VVPPQAAARVPVSKVSEAAVPPNGSSMWVWASMPPGITYLPVASTTWSTLPPGRRRAVRCPARGRPTICSPSTRTSADAVPVALTTVPPLIRVVLTLALLLPAPPILRKLSGNGNESVENLSSADSFRETEPHGLLMAT